MPGYDDLAGFIPAIRDYGLGAAAGIGGRVGFAGCSKSGTAATFYSFKNLNDVKAALGIGPAVEQLQDLFRDGEGSFDRELNVKEVIYYEINVAGGTAASATVDITGAPGGSATAAMAGTASTRLDRRYGMLFLDTGDIPDNDVRYMLCRNYDVPDASHRVWEGPYTIIEDTVPGTSTIYLEEPGVGVNIIITAAALDDFVVNDLFVITTAAAAPTVVNAVAAIQALARWRDTLGNGIGGTGDITIIGSDRTWVNTAWDDLHAVATDEWGDNFHPVQIIASVVGATLTTSYAITTWITTLLGQVTTYRGTTIPTNAYLNGALVLSAVFGLRSTSVGYPGGVSGAQVRHQCGGICGQAIRARTHWDIGWVERFEYKGMTNVYPWNSAVDNMTDDGANVLEYRTSQLNNLHLLTAWPRSGYIRKIVTDSFWAMCDNLSDYFKAPYFRIVGMAHVILRIWFATRAREPGISANDAAQLEAEVNASIIQPMVVDPAILGDAIAKPFNQAVMHIRAPADVLITEQLDYELLIVPTGSKHQLVGFTQLRRSL
jgi:hypothetical protein